MADGRKHSLSTNSATAEFIPRRAFWRYMSARCPWFWKKRDRVDLKSWQVKIIVAELIARQLSIYREVIWQDHLTLACRENHKSHAEQLTDHHTGLAGLTVVDLP